MSKIIINTIDGQTFKLNDDNIVRYIRQQDNTYNVLLSSGDLIHTIVEPGHTLVFVDWIQSTDTQYIKTGVIGDMDLEFEGDFTPISGGTDIIVFGYIIYSAGNASNQVRFHFGKSLPGVGSHVGATNIGEFIVNNTYTLKYKNRIFTAASPTDNTTADYTTRKLTNEDLTECYLFARHDIDFDKNDVPNCYSKGRISYWKIWDKNGTLIRDFKPCKYDNVPGMWDMVEGKFYGSASSTAFIAPN